MAQQNQTLDVLAAIQKLQGEEAKIANPTVSALSAAAKKFDQQDDAGVVFGGLLEGAAIGAQAKADKQTKSRLDSMKELYEQQLQYAQYSDELERYMKKAEATKKIAQDQQGAIDQIIMTAEKMDPAQASQFVNEQLRVNPYMRELLSNLADLEGGQGNFLLSNVTVDDAGNLVGVSTDGRTYNYGDFKGRLSPEGSKTISQAKSAEWAAKTPVEQAEAQVGSLTDQEKRIAAGVAKAPQIQGTPQDFAEIGKNFEGRSKAGALKGAAELVAPFKEMILMPDGSINREALATTVFGGIPGTAGRNLNSIFESASDPLIRAATGAAMTKEEAINFANTYKPSPLDRDDTIRLKLALLEKRIDDFNQATGAANDPETKARLLQEINAIAAADNMAISKNINNPAANSAAVSGFNAPPQQAELLNPPPGMSVTNDGSSGGVPELTRNRTSSGISWSIE